MRRGTVVGLSVVAMGLLALAASCQKVGSALVKVFSSEYEVRGQDGALAAPVGKQERAVRLEQVAGGFKQPTDLQFVPGDPGLVVVLQKEGAARWLDLEGGATGTLLEVPVLSDSEQGLLGLAFHPRYLENGRFFLHYTLRVGRKDVSRVEEWGVPVGADLRKASPRPSKSLLEVEQPYPNHNAGQLAFGPDGFLYIGFGDGGFRADPHGHGQDPRTWLGSMLRIDVDRQQDGRAYAVPDDNPFVGKEGFRPETWAYGLRNPWRYSFDRQGRLWVADVGQDAWEEVAIVRAGENHGWNVREGFACFSPKRNCRSEGLTPPVHVYGRDQGQSITGGYVYEGAALPHLRGRYLFGDFVTGRLWALALNAQGTAQVTALGRWPILPSTFGQAADGEVYLADFGGGGLYRLAAEGQ
jgi:glucose/arabinose dehydrogenase